ncbi:MAG: DUF177 domain-containing protein [bacterium]|nr:DUF177 domain-containing protein [bacterium]
MEEIKIPKEYFINIEGLREGVNEFKYTTDGLYLEIGELQKGIEIQLKVTKIVKRLIVKGKIIFSLELECARCLEKYIIKFTEGISSVFLPNNPSGIKSEEETEDPDVNFYTGKTISLVQLIRDIILLAIPIKPLCSVSCKGICPVCGKNLNEADCGCPRE